MNHKKDHNDSSEGTSQAESSQDVWGYVDGNNGARLSGDGFESRRDGQGRYTATFSQPFADLPAVVCTAVADQGEFRNITLTNLQRDRCSVEITNGGNSRRDNNWTFIATGS